MNSNPESHQAPSRIPTLRRIFRKVFNRRTFFVALFLASLVTLFYAVENWRGKRAWDACKRELEAKGEVLDWFAYVPKPVPDAENMMKVPLIESLFIRSSASAGFKLLEPKIDVKPAANLTGEGNTNAPVTLAEVVILLPNSNTTPAPGDLVYVMSDLAAGRVEEKPVLDRLPGGRHLLGAQGITLIERPLTRQSPLPRLYLRASKLPTARELTDLLNRSGVLGRDIGLYVAATTAPNVYRAALELRSVYVAADYLKGTDLLQPRFDAIRAAARRQYARIDADYTEPFMLPIPNYVAVRTVCQLAAQRAQACLLLGRPDQALRELALIPDVRRLLDSSQPTLVSAMINVAVVGLHVMVVEQGFADGLWQEPQWEALQAQLRQINLLPLYVRSIRGGERAAMIYMLETYPRVKLAKMFVGEKNSIWRSQVGLYVLLCPRGWLYQNAAVVARVEQAGVEWFDVNQQHVDVLMLTKAWNHLEPDLERHSAYDSLAGMMVPNFFKASITATRNQTFANEALLACAVERHRKANGAYPETLDALVPRFVDKLPHDIVNSQPLKYRRTDDGGYRLYSVGWDLKDDGGQAGPNGIFDPSSKDWVWIGPGKK
ncbi:MAG: hypothetical protein ACYDH9_17330 [Limisphaerales bacterium]